MTISQRRSCWGSPPISCCCSPSSAWCFPMTSPWSGRSFGVSRPDRRRGCHRRPCRERGAPLAGAPAVGRSGIALRGLLVPGLLVPAPLAHSLAHAAEIAPQVGAVALAQRVDGGERGFGGDRHGDRG